MDYGFAGWALPLDCRPRASFRRCPVPWTVAQGSLLPVPLAGEATGGTVKLTEFLETRLIDMPPKSLICRVGSNRFCAEKEWIQVNLTVPIVDLEAA